MILRYLTIALFTCAPMAFMSPIAHADDDPLNALMMGGTTAPTPSESGRTPSSPTTSTPLPAPTTPRYWSLPSTRRRSRSSSPTASCRARTTHSNCSAPNCPTSPRLKATSRRPKPGRRRTSAFPTTKSSANSTTPSTRSPFSIRLRGRSVRTSRTCWWTPAFSRTSSTRSSFCLVWSARCTVHQLTPAD
jgi:hypothetical protein